MILSPPSPTCHRPVLLKESLHFLQSTPSTWILPSESPLYFVDATLGGGGHTRALLEWLARLAGEGLRVKLLGIDQDPEAIERAHSFLAPFVTGGLLELHQRPFQSLPELLAGKPVQGILADLGFSSDQLEQADRGLSFLKEGPLDFRLNRSQGMTAQNLLETLSEEALEKIIRDFGEERFSRRIAQRLVQARSQGHLPTTTTELVSLLRRALPPFARHGRIHLATRTFQALRIAVNQELEALDQFLSNTLPLLQPGGRAVLISFHSLEDRLVKRAFHKKEQWQRLTPKPVTCSEGEAKENPRARSAKLRAAEKKAV